MDRDVYTFTATALEASTARRAMESFILLMFVGVVVILMFIDVCKKR